MSSSYRRYLQLIKNWPLDVNKTGRDFGQYIRDQVHIQFAGGERFTGDQLKCDLKLMSLQRLSESYHAKAHKRSLSSSSTGLNLTECNQMLANEFLQLMEEENLTLTQRLKKHFSK